jgi:hypothetical protein
MGFNSALEGGWQLSLKYVREFVYMDDSCVISYKIYLIYFIWIGSEALILKKRDEQRLEATQMKFLRQTGNKKIR